VLSAANVVFTSNLASRFLLAEQFLSRCSYLLADTDKTGLETRKAARISQFKKVQQGM
jgi:hypothetical protein